MYRPYIFMNAYKKEILEKAGRNCREKRKYVKMTQRDIAFMYGCTQQNISLFETGKKNDLILYLLYDSLDSPATIVQLLDRGK